MEQYCLRENRLILCDEELDLFIDEPFPIVQGDVYRNGETAHYYPSGELFSLCYYKEGDLHGPSYFYAQGGKVLSESWFIRGKQEGKMRQYYRSGALYCIQRYREGEKTGKQEFYYEDGGVKTLEFYKKGRLHGEIKLFWPRGQLKRTCHFIEGKRIGEDKFYDIHKQPEKSGI